VNPRKSIEARRRRVRLQKRRQVLADVMDRWLASNALRILARKLAPMRMYWEFKQ
jgi:hypothetical protein